MKHLELFKQGFDSTVEEKRKVENGPYVAYSTAGEVVCTEIPQKYIIGTVDGSIAVESLTENDVLWYGNKGFRGDITLLKEFTSTGGWNTITLPFTLYTLEGTPFEGSVVQKIVGYTPSNPSSSQFNFEEVTVSKETPMIAGYPYLISVPSDVVNPVFTNVKLEVMNNSECAQVQIGDFIFKGLVLLEPLDYTKYHVYGFGPNNRVVELYGTESISGLKLIFLLPK